jgi:hypothetical protein
MLINGRAPVPVSDLALAGRCWTPLNRAFTPPLWISAPLRAFPQPASASPRAGGARRRAPSGFDVKLARGRESATLNFWVQCLQRLHVRARAVWLRHGGNAI